MASAQQNILSTIKGSSLDITFIEDDILEELANSIAQNLGIEYQSFPDWNK